MRKSPGAVARFFAAIFAVLFVLTAIPALLLSTLERDIFKANLYKQAFVEQHIYRDLPGLLGEMLTTSVSFNPCEQNPVTCEEIPTELSACYAQALGDERYITLASGKSQPSEVEQQKIQACMEQFGVATQPVTPEDTGNGEQGGMPPYMKNLTAADWEAIIRIILPPADLQTMTENALDQVFAYLNGDVSTAKISLRPLKIRLSGPDGVEAVARLLRAQPDCTPEQIVKMIIGSGNNEEGLVFCNPGEAILDTVIPLFQKQLGTAAGHIPDEVTLIKPSTPSLAPSNGGPFGSGGPTNALRVGRWMMRLSLLLPLGFLLLVTLFAVRSFKSWMRWWGIPFFFTGAIFLFVGLAVLPLLNWAWDTFLVARIPPYFPANVVEISHGLARSIIQGITKEIILQALILITLGLAAWISSYFIKTKAKPIAIATPSTS